MRAKLRLSIQCLFVDPVADLAILGSPDEQELSDQWAAYDGFIGRLPALPVVDATEPCRAWLLLSY